ncbi:MAG: DUF2442 domain-containing protein [Betaproteobacteria bacterium]|jgi:hypothetical protein|nr:DUF2442 domain-containing protein [Rubrivivax sp.]
MTPVVNITSATQVGSFSLRLLFDDGTERVVDFESFLRRSRHPDIRAYLQPDKFGSFRLEHGDLVWGDWDLCFPISDLRRGAVDHRTHVATAD